MIEKKSQVRFSRKDKIGENNDSYVSLFYEFICQNLFELRHTHKAKILFGLGRNDAVSAAESVTLTRV